MTADLTTLRALKARVDAATGADRELDGEIARMEGWTFTKMKGDRNPYWRRPGVTAQWNRSSEGHPSYTASIDAAVALVERVLPQRRFIELEIHPSSADVEISMDYGDDWFGGDNDRTPPLAILSALLSALIAQAEAGAEESAAAATDGGER